MKKIFTTLAFGITLMAVASCKKFITIDNAPNELLANAVFADDNAATAAVTGIYSRMSASNGFMGGTNNVTVLCGLYADEFLNYSTSDNNLQFFTNTLVPANTSLTGYFWTEPYQYIYTTNAIIDGLGASVGVSKPVKSQLLGEARFIRAFCYFYLVNMFGEVPYITSTNYKENNVKPKNMIATVYAGILDDLALAKTLLQGNYALNANERIRPNKYAASALLARVYLYLENFSAAEFEASEVIAQSELYNVSQTELNTVFLKNSKESIWQIAPVKPGFNTDEGQALILNGTPTVAALTGSLYQSFDAEDPRRSAWIGTYTSGVNTYRYPFKYKIKSDENLTEYYTVLRLAEQYLIRAEARTQLNNLTGGVADLNVIRRRARGSSIALPDLSESMSKSALLSAVQKERRAELFAEWGHRWFDLKRTGQAEEVLKPSKGAGWNSTDLLFPIPQSQMQNNPNMVQNNGY